MRPSNTFTSIPHRAETTKEVCDGPHIIYQILIKEKFGENEFTFAAPKRDTKKNSYENDVFI